VSDPQKNTQPTAALPSALTDNPYVGPRTFVREQAHLFFGREREAEELFSRVVSQRLVLFYAQSGAGKSSLINTQLIPRLEAANFVVLPVGRVGGDLLGGVDDTVDNIYLFNLMLSLDQSERDPARLAHLTLPHFLENLTSEDGARWYYEEGEIGRQGEEEKRADVPSFDPAQDKLAALAGQAPNYVLIIDQFEEIITTHGERWRERAVFFQQLEAAMVADPTLWVVLTLREDFVASLDPYAPLLSDNLRARYYMQRMGVEAARQAISRPAEARQRRFQPAAIDLLLNNLSQVRVAGKASTESGQYIEPVQLQVVCYQLWEGLKNRFAPLISTEDVQKAGDVDRALASFYEETLTAALQTVPLAGGERRLRRWFEEKLLTEAGTRGTVYQGEHETAGLPNELVLELANRFLLRSEARSGGRWVELTHDRFVEPIVAANRAWETKQNNPLAAVTRLWLENGRDPARLLRGKTLEDAQVYANANPHLLTDDEQTLITTSVHRQAEEREEARQTAVRRRTLITTGTLLLLLFAGLAWWGWRNAQEAQRNADLAQQQVARLTGEKLLKEVRSRKERFGQATIGSAALSTPFVSPLAAPIRSPLPEPAQPGTTLTVTVPFTGPAAIVNEVATIRHLLAQAVAADATLQVDMALEEADVLRQAATRLVEEGERLAAQGNNQGAAALFQIAFDLQPPPDTLLYVWIEAGEFSMGSSASDSRASDAEKPQHTVKLSGYWIMRTEVTNAQYARCVTAQACTPPDNQRWHNAQFALHPVVDVDWQQANDYATWAGGRLPTEAEWEKACRGTDKRIYPWGDQEPSAEKLNYYSSGLATWTNVGSYPAGANGLFDMAGNVGEWTADSSAIENYKLDLRSLRGGGFIGSETSVRCAHQAIDLASDSDSWLGFRVVSPGF